MPLSESTLGPLGALGPWHCSAPGWCPGELRGQELLSLLAASADGAFYGISLGWDQRKALGLLNSLSHSCPWHTLTITQLLPRCRGLEPVLASPSRAPRTGLDLTLVLELWEFTSLSAFGGSIWDPAGISHPLQRAHQGQLRGCHGSLCCWSPAPGPWCPGSAIPGHQGRAVRPEHPWPARRCLPPCGDAAASVCLGSDGLFPACERLELGRSQRVYK